MNRREFITLLGGAAAGSAVSWPLPLRAQQPKVPVVGFLNTGSAGPFAQYVAGLLKGLNESGFSVGRNVEIEYRWAEGHYDRLPALAAELVGRPANVIVASGGEPSGLAAKAATSNIPIVFLAGGDPVQAGLVSSLNRPTGNLTGISQFTYSLEAKRLGLLHELAATADPIAVLINQSNPNAPNQVRDLQEAAARAGIQLLLLPIDVGADLDPVFATLVEKRVNALLISADPFFNTRRAQIVALAARAKVPAMYEFRNLP